MGKVFDNINDTFNAYYKMNSQVGNEKQTCLKQIKTMMEEKWSELTDAWMPKYAEECPSMDKCYKEEFDSFYSLNTKKDMNVSAVYTEILPLKEIETLDVPKTQKKL